MSSSLSDHVPDTMPDVNGLANVASRTYAITVRIMMVLFKPIVLTTDLFVRKNFGERYLTSTAVFSGWLVILVVLNLQGVTLWMSDPSSSADWPQPTPANVAWVIVGNLWLWGYVVMALVARRGIRARNKAHRLWHSYCMGEWRVRFLSSGLQRLILAGAGVLMLVVGIKLMGALLIFSLYRSFLQEAAVAKRIWEAVLDVNDRKIEAERLQEALDQKPAEESDGLLLPMSPAIAEHARRSFLGKSEPATLLVEPKITVKRPSPTASL